MRYYRVVFHYIISQNVDTLPPDMPPAQCYILKAETLKGAREEAEKQLKIDFGVGHNYRLIKNEALKVFEILLCHIKGTNDTTVHGVGDMFVPIKEKFFAATLDEAKEIAQTREASSPEFGGTVLDPDHGIVEICEEIRE